MNPRVFYYSGLLLILLAFALLPTQITVRVKHSPQGETETMGFGWTLAPVVGTWGFATLLLGAAESLTPGLKSTARSLPALLLIYSALAYATWMAIRYGQYPFWWIHFGLILAPSILATSVAALHFRRGEKLASILSNQKIRALILTVIFVVPLLFAASTWYFFAIYLQ